MTKSMELKIIKLVLNPIQPTVQADTPIELGQDLLNLGSEKP